MSSEIQSHLTDEALDDVLIGLGSLASHAHLAKCNACRARVELFQSNVDRFNHASLAFSQARPIQKISTERVARRLFARPVFAAWAGAAALFALAGPAAWHLVAPHLVHAPVVATQMQDSETQIAEDNELLRQVNAALAPDGESIVDEYHLLQSSRPQVRSKMRRE